MRQAPNKIPRCLLTFACWLPAPAYWLLPVAYCRRARSRSLEFSISEGGTRDHQGWRPSDEEAETQTEKPIDLLLLDPLLLDPDRLILDRDRLFLDPDRLLLDLDLLDPDRRLFDPDRLLFPSRCLPCVLLRLALPGYGV